MLSVSGRSAGTQPEADRHDEALLSSTDETRAYNSPLRERQGRRTRRVILEAASEVIVRNGVADFSLRDVAAQAEVSERTVYNYFANRQAVLDGLADHVDDRLWELGVQEDPRDVEDFTEFMVGIFRALDEIGTPARAMARLAAAQGTPSAAARERTELFRERFADALDSLPDDVADRRFAMLRTIVSATTWLTLRDQFELDPGEGAETIGWALETLLDDLRRRSDRG